MASMAGLFLETFAGSQLSTVSLGCSYLFQLALRGLLLLALCILSSSRKWPRLHYILGSLGNFLSFSLCPSWPLR
jgi:hypothetical protein